MRLRTVGVFVAIGEVVPFVAAGALGLSGKSKIRSRLSWLALLVLAAGALTAGPIGAGGSAALSFTALSHSAGTGGHYCALTNTGGVVCWGKNDNGEVGNGTRGDRYRPVAVVGLDHGVKQVSAGGAHTCALMVSGTVKCWGKNFSGQLGNGTNKDSYTPVSVIGLSGVRQITTGDFHSCALLSSGTVKCWGGNENGELGDGNSGRDNNRNRPVNAVSLGSGVAAVDASLIGNPIAQASEDDYTCVVTTAATARCSGGAGSVPPAFGSDVVEIDATTVCLLTRAGAVECNEKAVPGLESGVKQINQGCAVTTAGAVKCWLPKTAGQHGFDVGVESGAKEVAGSCALMTSGWIRCWGCGEEGSLGNGQKRGCVSVPVNVLRPISPSRPATAAHSAAGSPGTISFYANVGNPINYPAIKNPLVVRPSSLLLFQDGSWFLKGLRWNGWGSSVARATGVSSAKSPAGTYKNSPAQLTLSHPKLLFGHRVYGCYQLTIPATPDADQHACIARASGGLYLYQPVKP